MTIISDIKMFTSRGRKREEPNRFKAWKSGDSHEPFSIKNQKKKMKVLDVAKKEYQARYREKVKLEKQVLAAEKLKAGNEDQKNPSKGKKKQDKRKTVEGGKKRDADKQRKTAEKKIEILEYQKQYREKLKAEKIEKKKKQKIYLDNYKKMKKNNKK